MSLSEWLPKLQTLSRADKLRLLQIIAVDLAQEEDIPPTEVGISYPVWSPYHAFDAAGAMLRALDEEKAIG